MFVLKSVSFVNESVMNSCVSLCVLVLHNLTPRL